MTRQSWWALSNDALRDMLVRAHDGEDPDLLLTELYANSDTDHIGDDT